MISVYNNCLTLELRKCNLYLMLTCYNSLKLTEGKNLQANESADLKNETKYRESRIIDEESSYSSFYSSFLKTDPGSGSNDDSNNMDSKANKSDDVRIIIFDLFCNYFLHFIFNYSFKFIKNTWHRPPICPMRKRDPPWMESVKATPDLIYRYQMSIKGLEDILKADLNSLKEIDQVICDNLTF